jgi:hypothetical protein
MKYKSGLVERLWELKVFESGFKVWDCVVDVTKGFQFWEGLPEGLEDGYTEGLPEGLEDGYTEGLPEGLKDGYTEGLPEGLEDGYTEGLEDGYTEGLEDGYTEGLEDGYTEGLEDGYTEGLEIGGEIGGWEGDREISHVIPLYIPLKHISLLHPWHISLTPHLSDPKQYPSLFIQLV